MALPWESDDEGGGVFGSIGRAHTSVLAGPAGDTIGTQMGQGFNRPFDAGSQWVGKQLGYDTRSQKEGLDEASGARGQENEETKGVLGGMSGAENKYLGETQNAQDEYLRDAKENNAMYTHAVENMRAEARGQAMDARKTYSNEIQPRMKQMMEDAQVQAGNAMSLQEAGDPNNATAQKVRNFYDQQGQGVRNQGIADYGILSALGGQATQNTMGAGGPMTGAQMQLMNAGNQQQAGMAYQNAASRMQRLKEQGIEQGFNQSNLQYERGQRAKDRYGNAVGGFENSMNANLGREQEGRNQELGYAGQIYGGQTDLARERAGIKSGLARERAGVQGAQGSRELGRIGQYYGGQQAGIQNQIQMANAENASRRGIIGGFAQGGITGLGALVGGASGGPGGAAAGANAGNQAGANVNQGIVGQPYPPYQQPPRY